MGPEPALDCPAAAAVADQAQVPAWATVPAMATAEKPARGPAPVAAGFERMAIWRTN